MNQQTPAHQLLVPILRAGRRTSLALAVMAMAAAGATAATAQSAAPPAPGAEPPRSRELPSWGRAPEPRPEGRPGPGDTLKGNVTPLPGAPAGKAGAGDTAGGKEAATGKAAAWKQTETPDTPAQRRRMLDDLYAHLATVGSAEEAAPLVMAIERLWLFTGNDTVDVLMERVLKAVTEQRLELAEQLSDAIVEMAPGYAEGWNRRALVAYLKQDFTGAVSALRRALSLEPSHFKALDGIAQVMRESGERKAALEAYRRLSAIHPHWDGAAEALDELEREVEGQGI